MKNAKYETGEPFPLKILHVFSAAIILRNCGDIHHAFTDLNLLLGKTYIIILKNTWEPYCHMNLLILFETFSTNFQDLTQMQLGLHFQLLSNSRMDFGIMEIMEFFPLMHIWFFHHNHLACLENWFMKCMVKLDIVSVEILTNITCVPVAHVFRKIHVHTLVHVVSASRSRSICS